MSFRGIFVTYLVQRVATSATTRKRERLPVAEEAQQTLMELRGDRAKVLKIDY